jgi:signal transduction histidine kinase
VDHLQKLIVQIRQRLFANILMSNLIVGFSSAGITFYIFVVNIELSWQLKTAASLVIFLTGTFISYMIASRIAVYSVEPVRALWQAILHIAPDHQGVAAPNLQKIKVGRELITSLTLQIYQLASSSAELQPKKDDGLSQMIATNLPIPVIVMNSKEEIIFVNSAVCEYTEQPQAELIGKNFYSLFDFSFPNEQTLDAWLNQCRSSKVTSTNTWDHIRLNRTDKDPLQLDLVAYYNKDNPSDIETILALFDRTKEYEQDDQALGYVALAVHELRTPLTMLRGYIEVIEDELSDKLDPEMRGFVHKMQASSEQLSSFVNNILSVAKVENNQLELNLKENSWSDSLRQATEIMELRARVNNKKIVYEIAQDLPSVGIDKFGMTEVICNLLDNAIKYSNKNDQIIVSSRLLQDGMVETTVQDFGIGIPQSVLPNLFEKFYRNHRTRSQIGGTGLGLYLCKAIVKAHGGEIWVRSKEGEGTTFGFTIPPYAKVADKAQSADNETMTQTAHGWIKNHSFYRR